MLTEAVRDEIGRASLCWLVAEDVRGRPTTLARDAWAPLEGAVAVGGALSPAVLRDLAISPWVVAGFLDAAGRRGWRVEGPGHLLGPGAEGFEAAREALEEAGFAPPRRVLRLAVARLDRLDLEADDLLPAERAAKGMALLRARETG